MNPRSSALESHVSSEPLAQRFEAVRAFSEQLVSHLAPDDLMVQSMPDASPAKWHLAHTTWFFETFLLSEFLPGYRPFDPEFRNVFNSYYKGIGKHPVRGTRGTFSRPTLERVLAYRAYVNDGIQTLLASGASEKIHGLVVIGLNHEQQHQELIVTDIKHGFWSQPMRPTFTQKLPKKSPTPVGLLEWTEFAGGKVEIGHAGDDFSFDNELPRHALLLNPYRIANRVITNREYQNFMEDDGYRRPELWLSEGWDTVVQQGWESPLYWDFVGEGWQLFTAAGTRDIDPDEPVCHVSFFEADAFARWAGARLPVEGEWEHAAESVPIKGVFAESETFHPSACDAENSLSQMYGDLWEWTGSAYLGYPGFQPAPGAVGEYNGKFMCNQFVLRGGSCATPQSHIRATYRNFFPPSARWQFMGIRLASDAR